MNVQHFSWIDCILFIIITSASCCIGLYFAIFSKQKTANDYLFGGRNMQWLPVSISLASSALSGHSILGLATEVYLHGSQIFIMSFSNIIAGLLFYFFFMPVFYDLQVNNVFQYLEIRFNKYVKNFIVMVVTMATIILLPLYMYSPSLTFNQVTGVNVHIISPIMTLVCVFYTSFGGVKAVVWADALQLVVTVVTLLTVVSLGVVSVGGFGPLMQRADEGERMTFFDFNPDPTARMTFWSMVIGFTVSWCTIVCISPSEVQRCLSISKISIKKLVITFTVILCVTNLMCMTLGLVIYAYYFTCDPKSVGKIYKADQIVPYFITEITSSIPGFNGIFLAAIFGSALSLLSTILHTFSGVIYNDAAHWILPRKFIESYPGYIMKSFVVGLGILSIGLTYIVEQIGTIFEMFYYLKGITSGAFFGIYILGLFVPFANTKGAYGGGIASLILMGTIIVNNQIYVRTGGIMSKPKPLQTYGCSNYSTIFHNSTLVTNQVPERPFWLFRVSFQYYDLIGTLTTVLIGILISWLTKREDDLPVNKRYLSPAIRRYYPKYYSTYIKEEAKALNQIQPENINQGVVLN